MRVKDKNGKGRTWCEQAICGDYGPVEFDAKGIATVPADIGKAMCEAYPDTFSEAKSKKKAVSDANA